MKLCQARSALRASRRRLFQPACERLEDVISPNDLGLFRAANPLAGLVDPFAGNVQVLPNASASSRDSAAYYASSLTPQVEGSQTSNPALDAYFASQGTLGGLPANGAASNPGRMPASPTVNTGSIAEPSSSATAGNGLANPFQDPLSATGPFGAGNHAATSGGGSAGSSSPAPGGSAGGSSSGGSGGAASAAAPAASSASPSAGAAGPSLPLPAAPATAPAAPANNQGTDVATIAAATTHQAVTIQSPGHRLQDVQAIAPPAAGVNLPLGLFGFKVLDVTPGGSATVTMTLPANSHPTSYDKIDPTTGQLVPFNFDGKAGAEIHANVITLHLVDGGPGDADGRADGVITDPGGPVGGNDGTLTVTAYNPSPFTEGLLGGAGTTLATFTDSDNNHDPSQYTATITWGDTTTTATTVSGSGPFTVTSPGHKYLEEGTFSGSVSIGDKDGASGSANFTATVNDPSLTAQGTTITAVAGVSFTGVVATFQDLDPGETVSDYSSPNRVTINWGGGNVPGTVASDGHGGFTVTGTNTYSTPGTYTATVTITDAGSNVVTATTTVNVQDMQASAVTFTPVEGNPFSGVVATFVGSDTSNHYSATITWISGVQTSGTIGAGPGANNFTVSGNGYAYAEEGQYPVSVTVSHAGGSNQTVNSTANVSNAPLTATPVTLAFAESQAFTGAVATFTDADPGGALSDYTATITWGDGSGSFNGSISSGSGYFIVSNTQPHSYEESASPYSISVTITDTSSAPIANSTVTITSTANVSDPALTSQPFTASASAMEGQASANTLLATFTDPDPNATKSDYTASISWGDLSQQSSGDVELSSGQTFNVYGSHAFTEEGTFKPVVTIKDSPGNSITASNVTFTVGPSPLSATSQTVTPVEGASFSGAVASFTDGDQFAQAGDFTATIDWGQGPVSASVAANGSGGFNVSGAHTYDEEGSNLPILVTIKDTDGGNTVTASSVANCSDAPLTSAGSPQTIQLTEGGDTGNIVVATFTDADPKGAQADYTATIAWGDGSSTPNASISLVSGTTFNVKGDHIYTDENASYTASVTIQDAIASVTATNTTVVVGDAALSASGAAIAATEGASFSGTVATVTDLNPYASAADFTTITIVWGDGATTGGSATANGNGSFAISGTHTYKEEGAQTLTVTVKDTGGSTASVTFGAGVGDAALTLTGQTVAPVEGASFTGTVATLADANPYATLADFTTVTINWGDNSSSAGTVTASGSSYAVSGTHTYAEEGTYSVTVTVTDDGGKSASTNSTANVADALISGNGSGPPVNATEGTAFTVTGFLGNFQDADPGRSLSDYTATIMWGDGTTSAGGIYLNPGPVYSVTTSGHTYAEEGTYTVSVLFKDVGGASATINAMAVTVGDAPISSSGIGFSATTGQLFTGPIATASDPAVPGDAGVSYSVSITWGDGSATDTSGSVSNGNVIGTHTYASAGTFTINITVTDDGGSSTSTTSTATVSNPDPNFQPNGFPDPAMPDTCGCQRDVVATAQGLPSSNDGPTSGFSQETPVRFFDGVVQLDSGSDVSSSGFGMEWGLDRSWTNGVGYAANAFNGSGMVDSEMPYIMQDGSGNHYAVITNGTNARFYDLNNSVYTSRYYLQEGLSYDSANHQFVLNDTTGQILRFWDFSSTLPVKQRGQFQSLTDPYGNVTSVVSWTSDGKPTEVQRSVTSGGQTTTESFLNAYIASGVNAGLLSSVTFRRQVNGAAWSTIRQAIYSYGDGTQPYANAGDLMLVTVNDGAGHTLDTSYYRYYTSADAPGHGYVHGLKYYFSPESYARMAAALGNPLTAGDMAVAGYSDDFLQYDAVKRVSKIVIQGQGEYDYTYALPTNNANGVNSYKYKTTETLSDGSAYIAYANYLGEIMLQVFVDKATGNKWETFYKYNSQGALILTAEPSAVTGYTESAPDLLHNVNGNYQYLSDSTGLIETSDYFISTTAGPGTPGNVTGYAQDSKIQQGEFGTPVLQSVSQYFSRTSGGQTIYVPASDTVYRNSDGSGAETSSYSYTWYGNTFQVQSMTVSLPVVSAAQNGPGAPDTETSFFDFYGNEVWHKDADGFLSYTQVDPVTGAVVKTIDDVNTALTGNFQNLPSGWTTPTGGGLNLITLVSVDALGRPTEVVDPNSNITYVAYNDPNYEVLVYPGWNSATGMPTGPTEVTREDRANSYVETFTMSAAPHLTNGVPDGTEAVSNLQTLSRTYVSSFGQVVRADDYFNLAGVAYATAPYIGTAGTNYYSTVYGYDVRGRQNHEVSPTGTITDTAYDGLGRVAGLSVGTNDGGTGSNMVQISTEVYDNGGIGDSNLTTETIFPGGSAAPRVSQYFYDWRDELVASKAGVQANENDGTHRPILYTVYDNLGEAVTQQQYDGDGVSINTSNGVPQAPAANLLRAQSTAGYDDQGRVYQTQTFLVDQSSGAVSANALTTNVWYDHRGNVIKTSEPGGLVQKAQYDGVGRETVSYVTDGGGDATWADAGNVVGDNVLTQTETQYDANGNPILVTARERNHNETATGALGNATTTPKARVSYAAAYYDGLDRPIATVDVGTNGGAAYTRPGSPPASSDATLVSAVNYNAAGWESSVTDPRGIVNLTNYDNLGRTVQTIAAYTNGVPTTNTNSTTNYTYDGDNNLLTYSAVEPGGQAQTTQYVYGVSPATGSDITSNDILAAVRHPDPTTGQPSAAQQDSYTVNALGETKTASDRNGNVHTYAHDILGRLVSDSVTTLGAGVDGAVRRLEIAYDTGGRPYLYTSFDAPTGGNVVNQVQQGYNGLAQLTAEYQSHAGAVNTSSTPAVQYAYTQMAGGQNNSRLVSMTYPNGRVLNYNYQSGLDSSISRLTSISDSTATLESYKYLGLDTVVERDHPQNNVNLTYISQSGGTLDAGDQYTGLDRFSRVVDQNWVNATTGVSTDRFQYGYDRNGNVLYKNNVVDPIFSELYHASGAGNGYDPLNQLTGFVRGTLSASMQGGPLDTVASPSATESWNLDALGNWSSVTTNGVAQNRTVNQQNEVTSVGAQTLAFDANGNTLVDERGQHYTYDAWNQLVKVTTSSGGTTLAAYSYDALGRRIVENEGGVARDLYYSAAWQVLEERVSGATKVQYVWSPVYVDALVERDRDPNNSGTLSERLYVQQDANWNVTALVDTSGNVKERYLYDPYGQVTVLNATWATLSGSSYAWNYLHQGGRFDSATGLYGFRNRDYSPTLGRWMQVDPMSFLAGDSSLYAFVFANPATFGDPTGLGVGHHWVPRSILLDKDIRKFLSKKAFEYGWKTTSGDTGGHGYGSYGRVKHSRYNEIVKEELQKYMKKNGISRRSKMTQEQMEDFLEKMKNGKDCRGVTNKELKDFNEAIMEQRRKFLASRKGSGFVPSPSDQQPTRGDRKSLLESSGFFDSGVGALLTTKLADEIMETVGALEVMSESKYFRLGMEALANGDLAKADVFFFGSSNSRGSNCLTQVLSDKGFPKAALLFEQEYNNALQRAKQQMAEFMQEQKDQ